MSPQSHRPRPAAPLVRPVVLYDGACPLCRREIDHYRRLRGAVDIDWIDIAHGDLLREQYGIVVEQALARLHVRDRTGRWQTGAAAFVVLWSELPAYRWLGRGIHRLGLTRPLEAAYRPFARWRLRRRCRAEACGAAGG